MCLRDGLWLPVDEEGFLSADVGGHVACGELDGDPVLPTRRRWHLPVSARQPRLATGHRGMGHRHGAFAARLPGVADGCPVAAVDVPNGRCHSGVDRADHSPGFDLAWHRPDPPWRSVCALHRDGRGDPAGRSQSVRGQRHHQGAGDDSDERLIPVPVHRRVRAHPVHVVPDTRTLAAEHGSGIDLQLKHVNADLEYKGGSRDPPFFVVGCNGTQFYTPRTISTSKAAQTVSAAPSKAAS